MPDSTESLHQDIDSMANALTTLSSALNLIKEEIITIHKRLDELSDRVGQLE